MCVVLRQHGRVGDGIHLVEHVPVLAPLPDPNPCRPLLRFEIVSLQVRYLGWVRWRQFEGPTREVNCSRTRTAQQRSRVMHRGLLCLVNGAPCDRTLPEMAIVVGPNWDAQFSSLVRRLYRMWHRAPCVQKHPPNTCPRLLPEWLPHTKQSNHRPAVVLLHPCT